MNAPLEAIRQHADTANMATYVRFAFAALGVLPENIKSVHRSTGGFSAHPERVCVTLYHAVRLSAERVNSVTGFSGAVWNGNVCYILVGKE